MLLFSIFIQLSSVSGVLGIFGGELAQEGEFPHQVQLLVHGIFFCGGSIISPDHVLTAAHCLERFEKLQILDQILVVAGTNRRLDLQQNGTKPEEKAWEKSIQVRLLANYFPHPSYNRTGEIRNDIGILLLKTSFQFTEKVKRIPLIPNDHALYNKILISGWGESGKFDKERSPFLKKVEETIISPNDCVLYHVLNYQGYPAQMGNIFCAKTDLGYGLCPGDSGGGALCDALPMELVSVSNIPNFFNHFPPVKVLCAVAVSVEKGECGRGFINFFTNVRLYLDWIHEVMFFNRKSHEKIESFALKCDQSHFYCPSNRTCIERGKLCDTKRDCGMGEDELGDGCVLHPLDCKEEEFRCSNGRCLTIEKKCNGVDDCFDSDFFPSDEEKCFEGEQGQPKNCSEGFFDCGETDRCIPDRWKCDQMQDCTKGSDEEFCGVWDRFGPQTFWGWTQFLGFIHLFCAIMEKMFRFCCSRIKKSRICSRLATLDLV